MTIKDSIEEELYRLLAETSQCHDWTLKDKTMTRQALTRIVNKTLESLLEDMPEERKDGNGDTVYGYNLHRKELKTLIESKKI